MKSDFPQARAASVPGIHEPTRTPAVQATQHLTRSGSSWFGWTNPVQDYWVDACQRWFLTLDALRQRGKYARDVHYRDWGSIAGDHVQYECIEHDCDLHDSELPKLSDGDEPSGAGNYHLRADPAVWTTPGLDSEDHAQLGNTRSMRRLSRTQSLRLAGDELVV